MIRRFAPLTVLCLLLGSVRPVAAQATLHGSVVHDSTSRPISGVEVVIEGKKRSTGEVHRVHAAAAQLALDGIALAEPAAEVVERGGRLGGSHQSR